MNRLKYLSVVLFAAILAGVVFVACNDDDPSPADEGRKAANEMCGCVTKVVETLHVPPGFDPANIDFTDPATLLFFAALAALDTEVLLGDLAGCPADVAGKYQKYVGFEYDNFDEETWDLFSVFVFKDKDFETAFMGAAASCDVFTLLGDLLLLFEQNNDINADR